MSKSTLGIGVLLLLVIALFSVGDYFFFGKNPVAPPQPVFVSSHGTSPSAMEIEMSPSTEAGGAVRTDPIRPDPGRLHASRPAMADRETMMAAYRKKLADIRTYLEQQKFDYVAMKKKLRMQLKASENGKLSEEDILSLLPQEIAGDFKEMMDLLMRVSEMDHSSPLDLGGEGI